MTKAYWHMITKEESLGQMAARLKACVLEIQYLETVVSKDELKKAFHTDTAEEGRTGALIRLLKPHASKFPLAADFAKVDAGLNYETVTFPAKVTTKEENALVVAGLFAPDPHYVVFCKAIRLGPRAGGPGMPDTAWQESDSTVFRAMLEQWMDAYQYYSFAGTRPGKSDKIDLTNEGKDTPARQFMFSCGKVAKCVARVMKRFAAGEQGIAQGRTAKRPSFFV
jgi:hypothetical protein